MTPTKIIQNQEKNFLFTNYKKIMHIPFAIKTHQNFIQSEGKKTFQIDLLQYRLTSISSYHELVNVLIAVNNGSTPNITLLRKPATARADPYSRHQGTTHPPV